MPRIRVVPPVYLGGSVAVMAALHRWLPVAHLFSSPWRWLGLIPLISGLLFGVWAVRLFRKHQTTIKPGQPSTHLLTDGPFRFSRNPIYAGMVVVLAGAAILFGSLSPWLVLPIFVALIDRNVIPVEEAMLQETFGTEYRQYKAKVRRWI